MQIASKYSPRICNSSSLLSVWFVLKFRLSPPLCLIPSDEIGSTNFIPASSSSSSRWDFTCLCVLMRIDALPVIQFACTSPAYEKSQFVRISNRTVLTQSTEPSWWEWSFSRLVGIPARGMLVGITSEPCKGTNKMQILHRWIPICTLFSNLHVVYWLVETFTQVTGSKPPKSRSWYQRQGQITWSLDWICTRWILRSVRKVGLRFFWLLSHKNDWLTWIRRCEYKQSLV